MQQTIDEIKTVIALTGSKRIPELEAEIFANNDLRYFYIITLCKQYNWYFEPRSRYSLAILAYDYSVYVMRAPWPDAEPTIRHNSAYHSEYCRKFKHII